MLPKMASLKAYIGLPVVNQSINQSINSLFQEQAHILDR